MMVPRSRLLFWVAAAVLPFTAVSATIPSTVPLATGAIGALVLVVLIDAALAWGALDGIGASLPDVVRLSKDREGEVPVRVENDKGRQRDVRLGLAFPRDIVSPWNDIVASLKSDASASQVSWPCTPLRRGVFSLENVYLEGTSPLGFWAVRRTVPAHAEVRVYPNLFGERRQLAALFLNRGRFGIHAQRQIGKGREFEKLREYIPGDSYDEIHWKATAKRGHPITKMFQLERTQEVYVVLDTSRLSARTVPPIHEDESTGESVSQLERFITASLVLGLAAERQGDLFGLITFSDQVHNFIRAKGGKAHYSACRDAIYTIEPELVNPDFDEMCTFIRLRLRRRALLVFLTNLDDPILSESFVRNAELLRRRHLVLVNMITPKGVAPLFTDPDVRSVDEVYRRLAGHIQWHDLRETERVLRRCGVSFSLLENEGLAAELVSQYISIKQRQLL
jgi:uncharacterized protein (DUF58 family)